MKSPLYLSALITFFLFCGHLLAGTGELHPVAGPARADAGVASPENDELPASSQFNIPGPLRSFLRMAGISQKIAPEEVLPLLARNVFSQGYENHTRPTEFLILLRRYVGQAKELSALAASNGMVIRVSSCADAGPLLHILGYRASANCGEHGASLQTEDAEKAFLTIDSGFPLPDLEEALQGGKPFEYLYTSSSVPVLFSESTWTQVGKANHKENSRDLIDTLLHDAAVARLYWAFSKVEPETASSLLQSGGLEKLLPYAGILDFYGRRLCVRDGRVLVPGGPAAEPAWKELVGASPSSPGLFVQRLLSRDKGWLAAYFDVLLRANGEHQAYFTDPHRLALLYAGLRSGASSVEAARGVFRPAPDLLLLTTRLQFDHEGQPLVPGNLDVWKDLLVGQNSHLSGKLGKGTEGLNDTDHLLQLLIALSRANTDSLPVQSFMAISQLDSKRSPEHRLSPETVRLLGHKFEEFSDQYRIFSEFPELSDESIALFLDVAQSLSNTPSAIRGNAFGIFQANVGLWQILVRQGQIANGDINDSWQQVVRPFTSIRSAFQLYDAGQTSFEQLYHSATGKATGSQDGIIELLAGPRQTSPEGLRMHRELASRIRSVLDDQRLVSLDTLFTLGNAFRQKEQGKEPEEYVIHLASQTREFQMPRPIFTNGERTEWAAGVYNDHHAEVQMRTDLQRVLKSTTAPRAQIDEARGQLASFLRDTLVGLNYAYYEPPGAQALHNNPLLVRSHDFAGETIAGIRTLWQAPALLGEGSPAGGGAHFVGSIADLPYALAEIEQDFISPDNVQALVWQELAPELLTSAVLPRWWNVTPLELHAVALYQRTGEELLTAAATDESLRGKVMSILSDRLPPQQSELLEKAMRANRVSELIPQIAPADTFYLAAAFLRTDPGQSSPPGTAMQELQKLCDQHPDQVNWSRLSHDFGTPHPSLAQNYGLELLNLPPMPAFYGESMRFLPESWDSSNLYWARLADEAGYSPVTLNHLVPELTRLMIKKIFATDLEDWPALVRAMHETGEDFRQGKLDLPQRVSADSTIKSSGLNDRGMK